MIQLSEDGFETLEFTRATGEKVPVEFDLFKAYGEMLELSGPEMPDSKFFEGITGYLKQTLAAAGHDNLKISHLVAKGFYDQVRARVNELKKKDPSSTFAGNPEPTDSPPGPTPAGESPPAS